MLTHLCKPKGAFIWHAFLRELKTWSSRGLRALVSTDIKVGSRLSKCDELECYCLVKKLDIHHKLTSDRDDCESATRLVKTRSYGTHDRPL